MDMCCGLPAGCFEQHSRNWLQRTDASVLLGGFGNHGLKPVFAIASKD
jgi:hypothetical protein